MSKKSWMKRLFTGVLAAAMVATTTLTVAGAVTPEPGRPDPAKKASITVTKIGTKSESSIHGTGLALSEDEINALGGVRLENVGFTLYKVNDTYTVTNTTTPAQAKANATAVGTEKLTDANGVLSWGTLDHGYYVLSETTPPPISSGFLPAADSIITVPYGITSATGVTDAWNYDIHVYPKNVSDKDITKEADDPNGNYVAGDHVKWNASAKMREELLPKTPGGEYGTLTITDVLDKRLTLDTTTSAPTYYAPVITVLGAATPPTLVKDTDYTEVYTTATNTVVWTVTKAGVQKIYEAGGTAIDLVFYTLVNPSATGGTSTIVNNLNGDWNGEYTDSSDGGEITLGGIVIDKIDNATPPAKVAGAVFRVYANASDVDVTGATSGTPINHKNPDGTDTGNPIEVVTDANGAAHIAALPIAAGGTTYYLFETAVPNGYIRLNTVFQVTLLPTNSTTKLQTIQVVNQLLGTDPPSNSGTESDPIHMFQLPKTGGIGTVLFTVAGLSLIGVAAFLFIRARKKREA